MEPTFRPTGFADARHMFIRVTDRLEGRYGSWYVT